MADDIQRTLGRLESKLDALLDANDKRDTTVNERLNNHSSRIGTLERWQSKVLGAVAVVALLVGAGVGLHWLK
jgi:hypothetical protein